MKKGILVAACLACVFLAARPKEPPGKQGGIFPERAGPRVVAVERVDLVQRITFAGNIHPARRSLITPRYAGYVEKLHVRLGQHVKEGDAIVSITQTPQKGDEETFPLRSPISGAITQILKSEGDFVDAGKDSTVVRIDDLSKVYVQADLPEVFSAQIRPGMEAESKLPALGERVFRAVVREIWGAAKDQDKWNRSGEQVLFPVRAEVVDPDPALKPGMTVIMDILIDRKTKVLALPHAYVGGKGGKYFVTMEDKSIRPVKVGARNEEYFEILEGLAEGERVRPIDFLSFAELPG